jgi:hypothetical protein
MARTAARQQRTPFPTIQNAKQKQTAITKVDQLGTGQQGTPAASRQQTAFPGIQNLKLKRPTLMEDDVRLRAYEIYLRGDNHGDEVRDWLQAERELLAD